jgi:thioester reductase-like protein
MPLNKSPLPSHDSSRSSATLTADATIDMHQMLKKYSTFSLPTSVASVKPSKAQGHVLLVTGTTGALGSYLLDGFLRDASVARVYTFNRSGPKSQSQIERHLEGFTEKGLDPSIFHQYQGKWVMLEGDLTMENFGLLESEFLDLARDVTTIVHNGESQSNMSTAHFIEYGSAWTVRLSSPLSYFESQIQGVNKLLSFALASPQRPTFLYSSTFTVLQSELASSFSSSRHSPYDS